MNAEAEGRAAAGEFRRQNHLGIQPLGDLVALIEQATGIDVAVVDAGIDEHGLTMRDPANGAIFIAVARTDRPMRQRSTLAHELGHVIFRDWTVSSEAIPVARSPEERRADSFARNLLVPVEGLTEVLGVTRSVGLAQLSGVVQRFVVSPAMAAIALHQAGYIDEATKSEWLTVTTPTVASRFGWSDHYRTLQADSTTPRAPQRLLARAINGYAEHVVSAQTLGTLRGCDAALVEEELEAAGLVRMELRPPRMAPSDLPAFDLDLSELDDEEP